MWQTTCQWRQVALWQMDASDGRLQCGRLYKPVAAGSSVADYMLVAAGSSVAGSRLYMPVTADSSSALYTWRH